MSGAIPHRFEINADPALGLVISGQIVDEVRIPNPITYESSVLILLQRIYWKGLYVAVHVMHTLQTFVNENDNKLVNLFNFYSRLVLKIFILY